MKPLLFCGLLALGAADFSLASCSSVPAPQPPSASQAFSDAQACVVGILATSSGVPDVAGLLRCGLTAADLYALVTSLLRQARGGDVSSSAKSEISPTQAAWILKLETVKAQLEADAGR